MNLNNFLDLKNDSLGNDNFVNLINNFISELKEYLKGVQNKIDVKNEILEEDKTYVISDIQDNKLTVVDIINGDEIEIYLETGDENLDKFKSNNANQTFQMDREKFLNLNLTDNIILKDGKITSNTDEVQIKNDLAWKLLGDLYTSNITTQNQEYEVVEITDNKIYLTNADGSGGYFSIYKELYPNFEIGDIVKRIERTYEKVVDEV